MLVLTRKRSETIRIGDEIVVKVIRTGKSTVKIGIEAPANVRVMRGELIEGAVVEIEVEQEEEEPVKPGRTSIQNVSSVA